MAQPRTAKPTPGRRSTISLEYRETSCKAGEVLDIHEPGEPEVQILEVRKVEGRGFGEYDYLYKYVLIWR